MCAHACVCESEEEQDPNPTTAKEQTIPENAQMTRSGRISKPA
jgi:hypothetical protein